MVSQLNLNFPKTTGKIFILQDRSIYNPKAEIKNCEIEIIRPGYNKANLYKVNPFFNLILNSNLLNITNVKKEEDLVDIPDGIYNIKYSICPNEQLFVEYNYFRISNIYLKYIDKFCAIDFKDKSKQNLVQMFNKYVSTFVPQNGKKR